MVVEILIPTRSQIPLPNKRRHFVLDQLWTPLVVKACRKSIHQSDHTIRCPEQSPDGRGHRADDQISIYYAIEHSQRGAPLRSWPCVVSASALTTIETVRPRVRICVGTRNTRATDSAGLEPCLAAIVAAIAAPQRSRLTALSCQRPRSSCVSQLTRR